MYNIIWNLLCLLLLKICGPNSWRYLWGGRGKTGHFLILHELSIWITGLVVRFKTECKCNLVKVAGVLGN